MNTFVSAQIQSNSDTNQSKQSAKTNASSRSQQWLQPLTRLALSLWSSKYENIMKRNIRERDNTTMISSSLPDDRRQQPQSGTTKQLSNANHDEKPPSPTPSTSIPLPKSHIHRTPSELQLADDQKKADYEDLRMFRKVCVSIVLSCACRCPIKARRLICFIWPYFAFIDCLCISYVLTYVIISSLSSS